MSDIDQKNDDTGVMADHEYDGITEMNNPAPFWWQLFFYLSIAFSIGYYFYYETSGKGPSSEAEFAEKMAQIESLQLANRSRGPDEAALLAMLKQPADLQAGRAVYTSKCAACHAADGGGLVGPNLTDKAWLHGGRISQIFKTIQDGVLDKGMPAWGALLKGGELQQVSSYVYSLKGTKPASPKAAQGQEEKE